MSCVATMLQLLLVTVAVQPAWLARLAGPCLVSALVVGLWGWALTRGADQTPPNPVTAPNPSSQRMFSLRGAALVAALLSGVQAGIYGLELWLGNAGLLAGTLLASMLDLHSAMAAVLAQSGDTPAGQLNTLHAVILGLRVHTLSKSATAWLSGGTRYALQVIPGLVAHTVVAVGWLLIWPAL
jgi:uncharacterized membrane protein (DUF4010 family)